MYVFTSAIIFQVVYENTFKMEPPRKFRPDMVKPIIEQVLESNLEGTCSVIVLWHALNSSRYIWRLQIKDKQIEQYIL